MAEEIEKFDPIYTLKDPITFEDVFIDEISINLEQLKAADLDKAEAIYQSKKYKANIMEMSKKYNIVVAHLACDLPLEFFDELSARDYQQIYLKVVGFLNA